MQPLASTAAGSPSASCQHARWGRAPARPRVQPEQTRAPVGPTGQLGLSYAFASATVGAQSRMHLRAWEIG
eukprot:13383298-Alexandrium_andersonii.AAC.1